MTLVMKFWKMKKMLVRGVCTDRVMVGFGHDIRLLNLSSVGRPFASGLSP